MKRVLCILSGMDTGGAETFLMKIMRQLDKSKYNMDFCLNKEDNYYSKEIKKMGGKIYVITPKSNSLFKFKKELTNVIEKNHYIYVMRVTSNGMGFLDLKIAKNAGAKICIARSSNSSDGASFLKKVLNEVGKALYKRYIDVKIAPSDLAAMYTFGKKDYQKNKVHILNNGVDLKCFCFRAEARKVIRDNLKISEETKVFGHVGRFSQQKNHAFLIDVFNKILYFDKNSYLIMIGAGDLLENVKNKVKELKIENRVLFLSPNSEVDKYYSAMDALIFPSLYEGMPNVVIEAQATGLSCLLSDTITKDVNISGLVSFMSLDNTAEEWAKKALYISRNKRIDPSIDFIKKHYDIESATDEFVKLVFGE